MEGSARPMWPSSSHDRLRVLCPAAPCSCAFQHWCCTCRSIQVLKGHRPRPSARCVQKPDMPHAYLLPRIKRHIVLVARCWQL